MDNLKIIYQDSDLMAIDKPAGINSDDFEKRIHRLDKDTSGILLIAKNEKSLKFFQIEGKKGTRKKGDEKRGRFTFERGISLFINKN